LKEKEIKKIEKQATQNQLISDKGKKRRKTIKLSKRCVQKFDTYLCPLIWTQYISNTYIQSNPFITKSWETLNLFVIMSFVLTKFPSFNMDEKRICQIKKIKK
jgi:uncharacterized protein (DUF2344 family)